MNNRRLLLSIMALIAVALTGLASPRGEATRAESPQAQNSASQDLQWELIGPTGGEQVLDVEVDPSNSLRLFATTQNGIYRSTDGGANWDLILSGFFRDLVIDPQNSDNVYTGPGVYKSSDGGDSWDLYNEGMTCTNLATMAIAASNPNILFTGSF